jgi:hypothetical protein
MVCVTLLQVSVVMHILLTAFVCPERLDGYKGEPRAIGPWLQYSRVTTEYC